MAVSPLDKLSERERALLQLLAQGHTVKSAAAKTGDSENAANELLRSARRKLGVGSSREAARLLAGIRKSPQENCDEEIVIAERSSAGPALSRSAIGGIMLALVLSIVTGVVILAEEPSAEPATVDTDRPSVVSTYPADGSLIEPGPFELTVTFDRPMAWQVSILSPSALNSEHLGCIGNNTVKQSADRKSFTVQCEAVANSDYAVAFGDHQNGYFVDEDRTPAVPYVLSFSVSEAPQ